MTILERIHRYRLDVDPRFLELSGEASAEAYNGVGPERWPTVVAVASILFHRWAPAAYVHDNDYRHFNDGSREGWRRVNRRFCANGERIIRAEVGWWRFDFRWRSITKLRDIRHVLERSYLLWVNERLFDAIESESGWKAWREAFEKAQSYANSGSGTIDWDVGGHVIIDLTAAGL